MTNNDVFYVCALIEYVARETKNPRSEIVKALGLPGLEKQLHDAPVNHCLSFQQVGEELIHQYHIQEGQFDTITGLKYTLPSAQDIGKLYAILVEGMEGAEPIPQKIYNLFASFLSDEISKFSTDLYYQNPDYLLCSYQAGKLL